MVMRLDKLLAHYGIGTRKEVKNYIKFRINYSLELLNIAKVFDIKDEDIEKLEAFRVAVDKRNKQGIAARA